MVLVTDVRSFDSLDNRREVWHLLHRLSPSQRFAFLGWCCRQCFLPGTKIHPTPSWFRMGKRIKDAQRGDEQQDLALTNEIYMDVFMMGLQYGLSAHRVAVRLESIVRRLV